MNSYILGFKPKKGNHKPKMLPKLRKLAKGKFALLLSNVRFDISESDNPLSIDQFSYKYNVKKQYIKQCIAIITREQLLVKARYTHPQTPHNWELDSDWIQHIYEVHYVN